MIRRFTRTVVLAATLAFTLAGVAPAAFRLQSADFRQGAPLARWTAFSENACGGRNISPELHWSGAPRGTRSYALTLFDPDAPAPNHWWHWVIARLPATRHALARGAHLTALAQGTNSFGRREYDGPCPPPGKPHRYVFTIYALDVSRLTPGADQRAPGLRSAMKGHVLDAARLTGMYSR